MRAIVDSRKPAGEDARHHIGHAGAVLAFFNPSVVAGGLARRLRRYRLASSRGSALTRAFSRSMPWRLSSTFWRM